MTLNSDLALADWPQGTHVSCLSLYFLIHYRGLLASALWGEEAAPDKTVSLPEQQHAASGSGTASSSTPRGGLCTCALAQARGTS